MFCFCYYRKVNRPKFLTFVGDPSSLSSHRLLNFSFFSLCSVSLSVSLINTPIHTHTWSVTHAHIGDLSLPASAVLATPSPFLPLSTPCDACRDIPPVESSTDRCSRAARCGGHALPASKSGANQTLGFDEMWRKRVATTSAGGERRGLMGGRSWEQWESGVPVLFMAGISRQPASQVWSHVFEAWSVLRVGEDRRWGGLASSTVSRVSWAPSVDSRQRDWNQPCYIISVISVVLYTIRNVIRETLLFASQLTAIPPLKTHPHTIIFCTRLWSSNVELGRKANI